MFAIPIETTTSSNLKIPVHPREPVFPEEELWDSWDVKEGDGMVLYYSGYESRN